MEKKRVSVQIEGRSYVVISPEDKSYVLSVADEVTAGSGTEGRVRLTVGYYDIYGVQREYTLDDARPCMSRLVPTLAFVNVDING